MAPTPPRARASLGLAHALVAVGRLPVGSRVLDASSPPSGLSTSLAALGYDVSVVASSAGRLAAVRRRHHCRGGRAAHDIVRFARPGGMLVFSLESNADDARRLRSACLRGGGARRSVFSSSGDEVWEPVLIRRAYRGASRARDGTSGSPPREPRRRASVARRGCVHERRVEPCHLARDRRPAVVGDHGLHGPPLPGGDARPDPLAGARARPRAVAGHRARPVGRRSRLGRPTPPRRRGSPRWAVPPTRPRGT